MSVLTASRSWNKPVTRTSETSSARFYVRVLTTCILSLAIVTPLAAQAESLLVIAKAASQVGEKVDGYIELLDEAAPENIKKMVVDTNERRAAKYATIATKRGTTVESVAKLAGVKILERAKPGEMVQGADGKWVKK